MRPAHRTLIRHAMRHVGFLTEEIETLDRDILNIIESNGLQRPHQLMNETAQSRGPAVVQSQR